MISCQIARCPLAYADPSHLFFSPDDWRAIFFRMGLALLAGGAVGINRDRIKRPAGLRTYMTVSVGSAFFVMLILQAGVDFNATNALSRTVQGITTGVGFIGAGLIFHQQSDQSSAQIKGLTSAAALWLTASLGTAAGCGLWQMTLVGTVMTLAILSGFKRVKDAPVYKNVVRRKRFRTPPPVKAVSDQAAPP
jgi:putative Mg2+ transporter-C (MgtC) family protein